MRRAPYATAFAVACLLAAFAAVAGADPYLHRASGFECPDQLAGFTRMRVTEYEREHPGLGVACSYRLPQQLVADVYIYTAGLPSVPAGVSHPAMTKLHAQTVQEIEQFAQSRGERVRRLGGETLQIETSRGRVAVLHNGFVITSPDGAARETWLWLWTARNHVMKIRMTRPSGADAAPEKAREFAEAVVRTAAD